MLQDNKNIALLYRWIPFLATLVFVLATFSQFNDLAFRMFFNSDTLYLPSVYRDLFMEQQGIPTWQFNLAPNFFPDMGLYSLLMLLCGIAVFDDLCPNDHVSNQRWYFNDTIDFNFILLNGIKDTSFYHQRLRVELPPDSLEEVIIQRTAPFHYDKKKGYIPLFSDPGSE